MPYYQVINFYIIELTKLQDLLALYAFKRIEEGKNHANVLHHIYLSDLTSTACLRNCTGFMTPHWRGDHGGKKKIPTTLYPWSSLELTASVQNFKLMITIEQIADRLIYLFGGMEKTTHNGFCFIFWVYLLNQFDS